MTDYSDAISLFPPDNQVAAARVAVAPNPDQTAKIIPIAKQLGIPPALAETDPTFWTERARLKMAQENIGTTPLLSSWLAANSTNANLSSDDVPTLAKVAPTIPAPAPHGSFFDSISRGWTTTEHHRAVADAQLGLGEMPPALPQVPPTEPGITPYLRDTFGGFIGSMGSTLAHAAPVAASGAAIGAGVGAAGGAGVGGVGAIPGAAVGALVGGGRGLLYGIAADMALTAGGAAYEQSGAQRDGEGNSMPEPVRKFAAVAAGAGTAALTMLLPGIGKGVAEAGKSLITDTVLKAIPYVATEIGKAGVKGGLLNMAFAAVQSIPEEIIRLGMPGFSNLVNDPAAREAFIDKHTQAFIDGVVLFGALGVPGALVHPIGAAITAKTEIRTLDNLVSTSADSKLRDRLPEGFAEFVRSGNKDDIAINPADPAIAELLRGIGVPEEQIAAAITAGGDVHLPLSEYVSKVDVATHEKLREDIRMSPDGMTLREAAEAEESFTEIAPPVSISAGNIPGELPILRFRKDAAAIEATLPSVEEGFTRLWRGNRPGEVGTARQFTNDLPGIALPFREPYGGDISYVDVPTVDLARYENRAGAAPGAEFLLPSNIASVAKPVRVTAQAPGAPAAESAGLLPAGTTPTMPRAGETPLEVTRRTLYLEPLFKDALSGVMTKEEFERYSRLLEAQAARAGETAEPLAGARERAEEKVDRRRDVAAYNTIASNEGLKLDPTGHAEKLPAELLKPGGFLLDDLAPMLGYKSGAELARDLARVDREALIQREIAIGEEANGVINRALNSKQLDVLVAEARALGGTPLSRATLRETVGKAFEGMTLREASRKVLQTVMRGGRAAEKALLKGDIAGALTAKLQQAVAFERSRLQKTLEVEVARFDRLANRYSSRAVVEGRDQSYTDQIHRLLAEFGRPVARNEGELLTSLGGKSLEAFVQEKGEQGRIISDPPAFIRGRGVEQLTVAQFRELHSFLQQMDHSSRTENLVGMAAEIKTLGEVVGQIRDNLANRQERIDPTVTRGMRRRFRQLDAIFIRMERLMDWIDRSDFKGPLNTSVFRPIKEGQIVEENLRREVTTALRGLRDREVRRGLTDAVENQLIDVDGRPMRLTRGSVIAMALNMGTEANFKKLTEGYKWDEGQVRDLVNRTLTADEWKFVQGIWGIFDGLHPKADAVVRRVSGIGMDKLERATINTPHGDIEGGYYPLQFDPNRFDTRDTNPNSLFYQRSWFSPLPPAGYASKRVGNGPLRLDLNFIGNRISEIIHDIAYREAIISASKVLGDPRVKEAVDRSYGPEYTEQFGPWLQHIANRSVVDDSGLGFVEKLSRESRLNMNVLMLGFRPTTAIIHGVSALSNSIHEVGPVAFAAAVSSFFRHPLEMKRQWDWANNLSPELKNRTRNLDRDMASILDQWSSEGPPAGLASVRQHFMLWSMSLIATLDKLSAVPTWIAAHKQGLEKGFSEADAIAYGDKIVRNAHGSGGLPDLAPILRGPEYLKHFTMFMSYFNHNYNQVRDVGREYAHAYQDVKVGDMRAGTGHFISALSGSLAYIIVPAMVHELVKEGLPSGQQGDGWTAWTLRGVAGQMLSQVPIVRDVAHQLVQGHGRGVDVASPLGGLLDAMINPINDLLHKTGVKQGPVSKEWLKHAIAAPGAFIGLSTDQLGRTGQFLWDTTRFGGYTQYANDPVAWYRGLVYGESHPKVKGHR